MKHGSKRLLIIVFVGLFIVIGLLYLLTPLSEQQSSGSKVVYSSEDGFDPKEVNISLGEKLIFKNTGEVDHWPASNIHPTHRAYPGSDIVKCETNQKEKLFDACENVESGKTYTFTFNEPGTWKYHDHLFPQFSGTVVVNKNHTVSSTDDFPTIPIAIVVASLIVSFVVYRFSIKLFKDAFRLPKRGSKLFYLLVFSPLLILLMVILFWLITDSQYLKDKVLGWRQNKNWVYDDSIQKDSTSLFNDENAQYSYVKKFGLEAAVGRLQELEVKLGDCHSAAHEIGRDAYEIYSTDVFKSHVPECHSGGIHGATEAFFAENGTDNLQDKLKVICAGVDNSFFNHQCVHGVGHGLMAWTNYEIHDALENCDLLDNRQSSCYSGVFMENIVGGLAPEIGHDTKYLNDDPHFPCTVVDEKYISSCYFYQTSRMVQLLGGDFSKVATTCLEAPKTSQSLCFSSMGRDVGGAYREDPERAISSCSSAPKGEFRIECLNGAVQDAFWEPSGQDNAIKFCKILQESQEKEACYGTVFNRALDVLNTKEDRQSLCNKSEIRFQRACLERI